VPYFLLSLAVKIAGNIIARSEQRAGTPGNSDTEKYKLLRKDLLYKHYLQIQQR